MKRQRTGTTIGSVLLGSFTMLTILLLLSVSAAAQEKSSSSLAAEARDPTAPVTAFQIRYDWVKSYYNLADADATIAVVQPVIPFKIGDQPHIARITASHVTNGPDWATLSPAAPPGLGTQSPPYYVPTANKSGFADLALLDLLIYDASWGRWGVGGVAILPTASDPALGSEKYSLGPAFVAIRKQGALQYGALAQGFFSVAGKSDRKNVSMLSLMPFGGLGFGEGWSVGISDMNFNYDLKQDKWTSLPLGARLEKLVSLGKLPVRIYAEAEYNFQDAVVGPRWTYRFAFVPLIR